jgi:hypothetical protein
MKSIKILFLSAIVALVSFTSCKKFVDVNYDPNNNQSTRADYVMTGALGTTYRNQVRIDVNIVPGTWTGIYAHSTSFTGGGNDKTYEFTPADYIPFNTLFDNLADYNYVIKNADKDGFSYWKDPANVMQCYVYQELVDLYGNVPYETAFQGTANITPAYKDQKLIYEDLVVRLDDAMDKMNAAQWPTDAQSIAQDVYFGLNKTKWIQFANTLKLRILMRQSFMGGARDAYIQTNATSRASFGFLTENVLVSPGYANIAGKLNPFYNNFGYNEVGTVVSNYQYRKMNGVIINFLKSSGGSADTFRLQSLAYPAGSVWDGKTTSTPITASITNNTPAYLVASYIGVNFGVGSGFATDQSSPIGPLGVQFGSSTRSGMLMLAAESYFLQSEFAQKFGVPVGAVPGTFSGATPAETLFRNGIVAHYRTCAAPSTAGNVANGGDPFAVRYYNRAGANVNFTTSADKIKTILLQKWVSLTHINGLEQWSEYRKTSGSTSQSVPFSVKTFASTTNPEPVRYLYPQSEFDNNSLNVPAGISRFTSKIFWDVN